MKLSESHAVEATAIPAKPLRSVCVFCGSGFGADPAYAEAARETGRLLGARGLRLVYGGGRVGLMGLVADAALAAGGEVVGVIPKVLITREVEHRGLTELHEVDSMHTRKALMERMSDAFLVLPGGFGTLDEMCEILTWAQLGLHDKPIGLINTGGYYDALLAFFDHAAQQRFVGAGSRARVLVANHPATLLDRLAAAGPPETYPTGCEGSH
ncbi:MAG: TIGR00730 family Rossman fold protein [Nevskia sp.]